jgi:hypothetical protein
LKLKSTNRNNKERGIKNSKESNKERTQGKKKITNKKITKEFYQGRIEEGKIITGTNNEKKLKFMKTKYLSMKQTSKFMSYPSYDKYLEYE